MRSVFGKKIELENYVWVSKILKDHPEFAEKEEFLQEIRKTVEDPDYVITGWLGSILHYGIVQ
jgi:hypothetical protein